MPTIDFPTVPSGSDNKQVIDYLVKLQRDLTWTLSNLDSLNINHLDAKSITTGTLDATLVTIRSTLSTGYIALDGNGMVVNNGAFNTFEVNMDGEVTLTKALIRSGMAYPYVEVDPMGNYFRAASNAMTDIQIRANPDFLNTPNIYFNWDNYTTRVGMDASKFEIRNLVSGGRISVSEDVLLSGDDIYLSGLVYLNSSYPLTSFPAPFSSATEVEDLVSTFNAAMTYLRLMGIFV